MNLKTPTREPRNVPSLEKYSYWDSENVVQEDGRIAHFVWNNGEKEKGWQHNGFVDKFKFQIFENGEGDKLAEFDSPEELKDMEQFILKNEQQYELAENEEIHAYRYGGILSSRAGYFVTPKGNPKKVLRAKMIWMS
jgi:hypothetical protein